MKGIRIVTCKTKSQVMLVNQETNEKHTLSKEKAEALLRDLIVLSAKDKVILLGDAVNHVAIDYAPSNWKAVEVQND